MNLLIRLLITSIAIIVASYILSAGVHVDSFLTVLVIAIVMGAVNMFIKPFVALLTLPITIISLGLFMFILNALLVMLVDFIVPGFLIDSFWWALGFSLLVSIISSFLSTVLDER